MKTQIKQTIAKLSALAFVFALIVWVAPHSSALEDGEETVAIEAVVAASLQLAVNSTGVTINVDPDENNGQNWGTGAVNDFTTTTVNTNNLAGYKLFIELAGSEVSTGAQLDGTGTGNDNIIASGDPKTAENTFGFALGDAEATNATAFLNTTTEIADSTYGSPHNGHDQTIYYYLNVDYTTPADTYAGTITYTAQSL